MAYKVRYFTNEEPDFSPDIEVSLPKNQIMNDTFKIIGSIVENCPAVDRNGDGLYVGSAGISYMFHHLSRNPLLESNKQLYLQKAIEYIEPALNVAEATTEKKNIPSFILGPAGAYAVAAALFHAIGNHERGGFYREKYYIAAKYCRDPIFLSCGSDELFVGRAGYIMGALWMAKETNTPLKRDDLFYLCKVMLTSGRDYAKKRHCPCPLMYAYYKVEYFGAAHGLCSILQSILSVPGYLEENSADIPDIKQSMDYLLSLQAPDGNFPVSTDEVGYEPKLVHWCHGAGGMFYLMAKAYLVFKEDKFLDSCRRMADLIWQKGLLKKGPGICHGVAGNGYVFLIMYRLTSEPKFLYQAERFYDFMRTNDFKSYADCPYSLFEGIAGTVCYLSDLIYPQSAEFPFSDIF